MLAADTDPNDAVSRATSPQYWKAALTGPVRRGRRAAVLHGLIVTAKLDDVVLQA